MAASSSNQREKDYEQVGIGAVPDYYDPEDDEDDEKLSPMEKSIDTGKKEDKEEKEEDISEDKPLEL